MRTLRTPRHNRINPKEDLIVGILSSASYRISQCTFRAGGCWLASMPALPTPPHSHAHVRRRMSCTMTPFRRGAWARIGLVRWRYIALLAHTAREGKHLGVVDAEEGSASGALTGLDGGLHARARRSAASLGSRRQAVDLDAGFLLYRSEARSACELARADSGCSSGEGEVVPRSARMFPEPYSGVARTFGDYFQWKTSLM